MVAKPGQAHRLAGPGDQASTSPRSGQARNAPARPVARGWPGAQAGREAPCHRQRPEGRRQEGKKARREDK